MGEGVQWERESARGTGAEPTQRVGCGVGCCPPTRGRALIALRHPAAGGGRTRGAAMSSGGECGSCGRLAPLPAVASGAGSLAAPGLPELQVEGKHRDADAKAHARANSQRHLQAWRAPGEGGGEAQEVSTGIHMAVTSVCLAAAEHWGTQTQHDLKNRLRSWLQRQQAAGSCRRCCALGTGCWGARTPVAAVICRCARCKLASALRSAMQM